MELWIDVSDFDQWPGDGEHVKVMFMKGESDEHIFPMINVSLRLYLYIDWSIILYFRKVTRLVHAHSSPGHPSWYLLTYKQIYILIIECVSQEHVTKISSLYHIQYNYLTWYIQIYNYTEIHFKHMSQNPINCMCYIYHISITNNYKIKIVPNAVKNKNL